MKANKPKPSRAKAAKAKANQALAARRTEEVLGIRLDGAEFWDVREFVREKEKEPDSAWHLGKCEEPLSDSQIRRYMQAADKLVVLSHERSRGKLLRRHLAQRRRLYARAVSQGDTRTALAVLRDEAELVGLYPKPKVKLEHSGPGGGPLLLELTDAQRADSLARLHAAVASRTGDAATGEPAEDDRHALGEPGAGPEPGRKGA